MLFLIFQVKDERYCLEASRVVEVAPLVHFREIPHTPSYVAGLFSYRGTVVPVIDVSALLCGERCRPLLSTRIILVNYVSRDGSRHILGLLAEHVTETVSYREADFQPSGIGVEDAPFLDGVIATGDGMVQRMEVEEIIPETLQEYLFATGTGRE